MTDSNEEYKRYTYDCSMVTQMQIGGNYFNSLPKENMASFVATFPQWNLSKIKVKSQYLSDINLSLY